MIRCTLCGRSALLQNHNIQNYVTATFQWHKSEEAGHGITTNWERASDHVQMWFQSRPQHLQSLLQLADVSPYEHVSECYVRACCRVAMFKPSVVPLAKGIARYRRTKSLRWNQTSADWSFRRIRLGIDGKKSARPPEVDAFLHCPPYINR